MKYYMQCSEKWWMGNPDLDPFPIWCI